MKESIGNLWDYHEAGNWVVISTNGTVKNNGEAVMGRGCALEAKMKFPNLPSELGKALVNEGNHVFLFPQYKLITFPVKQNWWEWAEPKLIGRSCTELVYQVNYLSRIENKRPEVYCPRFGCGNGGLKWEDVSKLVGNLLADNFIILTQG